MRSFYVYIMASNENGTLYVGVTSKLTYRIPEHKQKEIEAFTKKYNINRLVYYEKHELITEAIKREKQIKNWKRKWKLTLVE